MAQIFLSYARDDNDDPPGSAWVSKFHKQLENRIGSIIGKKINVFLDQFDIQGNLLKQQILNEIRQAEILVTLLSPHYLNREWCADEREEFMKNWKQRLPGANPEERIFVAIKLLLFGHKQVDKDFINKLPAEFRGQLFFNFFTLDQNENLAYLEPHQKEFDTSLNNLANKLVNIWLTLQSNLSRRTVYVAETPRDIEPERAALIKELESRGFVVLPSTYLAGTRDKAVTEIDDYLKSCELSIHMLGRGYGLMFDDSNESLSELQYKRAEDNGLPMLVWLPKDITTTDARQSTFIENVKRSVSERADLIEGSPQDFLAEVSAKLGK